MLQARVKAWACPGLQHTMLAGPAQQDRPAQDYQNIKAGLYKLPWDMTTRGHHQWNPLWVMRSAVDFVREAGLTLGRCAPVVLAQRAAGRHSTTRRVHSGTLCCSLRACCIRSWVCWGIPPTQLLLGKVVAPMQPMSREHQ